MKRLVALLLALVMCLSLCACGGGSSSKDFESTAEDEIIGKWVYNTGITTWNFVFNEDMTCSYWAGTREPSNSTYTMENGELVIKGLKWDLFYEFANGKIRFWNNTTHDDGSQSQWEFTKDTTYDPSAITGLALTAEMIEEIEAEYNAEYFPTIILTYLTLKIDDLEFTDWEVTKAKKTDPYTYVVYGILYAKDNYGKKYYQNSNVIFTVVEDAKEASGYSIKWDIKFTD